MPRIKQVSREEIIKHSKHEWFEFIDEWPGKVTTIQQAKGIHDEAENIIAHEGYDGTSLKRKLTLDKSVKVFKSDISGVHLFTVWFPKSKKVKLYAEKIWRS